MRAADVLSAARIREPHPCHAAFGLRVTAVLASVGLALNGEAGRGRHIRRGGGTAGCP